MATVVVQQQHTLRHSTPPPSTIAPALKSTPRSSPIPNKHIPVCPTGPSSFDLNDSDWSPAIPKGCSQVSSILTSAHTRYRRISHPPAPVFYSIDASTLAKAVDHLASQPLPDPAHVFPWLHGLHPDNHMQSNFFSSRKRVQRQPPGIWRGLTIVKLGGDLTVSRLKNAIAPEEILTPSLSFVNPDPRQVFSVRNFQIQSAKLTALSDIVVYGEEGCSQEELHALAKEISMAQEEWRAKNDPAQDLPWYNTFVLSTPFDKIEIDHPELVVLDSRRLAICDYPDFPTMERNEMVSMTSDSEVSNNVFIGPSNEYCARTKLDDWYLPKHCPYDLVIDACEYASIPGPRYLASINQALETSSQRMEFPASGTFSTKSATSRETEDIINFIRWIYYLANPEADLMDHETDVAMETTKKPRKVFIHCNDGYTESSFLAVAYVMFAECLTVEDAILRLHCEKGRNFFLYPTDRTVLSLMQSRLLTECPVPRHGPEVSHFSDWFKNMDGSLPSRIMDYLYLGNLGHANNPELLWKLGIKRVLSMGEPITWNPEQRTRWGEDNLLHISIQDNGIDALCHEYTRCLEFIEQGKADGIATLVHCRVGVSRSASICIAEVMKEKRLSFPEAYCFVRARRLNVIIQPNLRFVYELLQWEEFLSKKKNSSQLRLLEWTHVCREIALLNRPYSRG